MLMTEFNSVNDDDNWNRKKWKTETEKFHNFNHTGLMVHSAQYRLH